jgi:hypothetical protein
VKGLSSAPQRSLVVAIRRAIERDPWFTSWLQPSEAPMLVIEHFSTEPWASMTFVGARHSLSLRLAGPMDAVERAWDRREALFVAPDLSLSGHFLADFAIGERVGEIGVDGSMTLSASLEALTIEE